MSIHPASPIQSFHNLQEIQHVLYNHDLDLLFAYIQHDLPLDLADNHIEQGVFDEHKSPSGFPACSIPDHDSYGPLIYKGALDLASPDHQVWARVNIEMRHSFRRGYPSF